ncbi:YbaK/EbsC family protein [Clostridium malenominatum]|uniref:YbaK/EbsC family protein n=1 Tax=Clostridium malenominatum TaxID=1539 RepID=A0ABN1J2D9_9CLOT
MSIETVRKDFQRRNIELEILEFNVSSATVELASQALGVEPGRIAKTMAFKIKDEDVLIVAKGDVKVDNRKFKDAFGAKAKMLSSEELLESTGHPVGGVCPFGLKNPLKVFLDESLRAYDFVYPAVGAPNSAVKVELKYLENITNGEWVDVCK